MEHREHAELSQQRQAVRRGAQTTKGPCKLQRDALQAQKHVFFESISDDLPATANLRLAS